MGAKQRGSFKIHWTLYWCSRRIKNQTCSYRYLLGVVKTQNCNNTIFKSVEEFAINEVTLTGVPRSFAFTRQLYEEHLESLENRGEVYILFAQAAANSERCLSERLIYTLNARLREQLPQLK